VRGAEAEFAELGPADKARRARWHYERGLPAGAERRIDRGGDHVDVGDAPVGGERLLSIEDPFLRGRVVAGPGADGGHIGTGLGLGRAEGGHLDLGRVTE